MPEGVILLCEVGAGQLLRKERGGRFDRVLDRRSEVIENLTLHSFYYCYCHCGIGTI